MRNLHECKAEIFRRSEEKIRARKKRRAVALGTGIPVCLCALAVLTAVTVGPRLAPTKSDCAAMPEVGADMIFDSEQKREYTVQDSETAKAVLELLDEFNLERPVLEDAPSDIRDSLNYATDLVTDDTYRIRLYTDTAELLSYLVTGLQVYNETTGETVTLSRSEAEQLKQLVTKEVPNE